MNRQPGTPFLLQSPPWGNHGARRGRQGGAEYVEIALTLGYFLILIFTFTEGVRLIYDLTMLDYLARDAVRYAVVRGQKAEADGTNNGAPATKASITTYVQNKGLLAPVTVTACWTANGTCEDAGTTHDATDPDNIIFNNSPGQPFRVTVSHNVFNLFSDVLWLNPVGTRSATAQAVVLY